MKNIEIKAKCNDLAAARRAAKGVGARRVGVLYQVDTYFHVARGRLRSSRRAIRSIFSRDSDPFFFKRFRSALGYMTHTNPTWNGKGRSL